MKSKNSLFIDISQFRFFKAWFILQRYERFAYRPFFTDMQATVTLEGSSR
ncbi:DUF3289 family protein [Cronobacter dublinensis]|nr:DUF3289 family protein [Cronobacter dublinensis]